MILACRDDEEEWPEIHPAMTDMIIRPEEFGAARPELCYANSVLGTLGHCVGAGSGVWTRRAIAPSRPLRYTDAMPTITDSMLKLIARDGYNVGETVTCNPDRRTLAYRLDASKGDERWIVGAPTRYEAAVELMEQLGWDLMDG